MKNTGPQQYVHTTNEQREMMQEVVVQALASPVTPKAVINYIHEGPIDDKHSSKRQRRRLFRKASIRERINSV